MHARVGAPSTCTVHAPHSAMPQPNFVPVMRSTSRSVHSSGVSSGTSAFMVLPLTFNAGIGTSGHAVACLWVVNPGPSPSRLKAREDRARRRGTARRDLSAIVRPLPRVSWASGPDVDDGQARLQTFGAQLGISLACAVDFTSQALLAVLDHLLSAFRQGPGRGLLFARLFGDADRDCRVRSSGWPVGLLRPCCADGSEEQERSRCEFHLPALS